MAQLIKLLHPKRQLDDRASKHAAGGPFDLVIKGNNFVELKISCMATYGFAGDKAIYNFM